MFPEGGFVRVQDKEYQCVLVIEGQTVVVDAYVETDEFNSSIFYITCQQHKVSKLHPDLGWSVVGRASEWRDSTPLYFGYFESIY